MAKKQYVEAMFNDIAPEYDKLNHVLSVNVDKYWRHAAFKRLTKIVTGVKGGKSEGVKVLDVACGTGDSSIELARLMPEAQITGADISEGMMAVGRKKISNLGMDDRMKLQLADSEAMPFEDNTFDAVTAAFGVRNFEHLEKGLTEMLRVLKPGGRLCILELSVPSNAVIRWFYLLYFKRILPVIGGMVSGNKSAYEYLPASVIRFPKPTEVVAMLTKIGYAEAKSKSLTFGLCREFTAAKK